MNRKLHPVRASAIASAAMIGRFMTRDELTFEQAQLMATAPLDPLGNQRGKTFDHAYKTFDGQRTVDSSGAFMVGELERLDQTIHAPLASVTWSRDIDLREDVSIADEISSFSLMTFSAAGSLGTGAGIGNGKAWISKQADQIGGVAVDLAKTPNPLTPWGQELKYTILELESAAKLGRPIDAQKYEALKLKHQMDIDEQVYYGDTTLAVTGLVNNALVTNVSNVAVGASSSKLWSAKTPAEILADVNAMLQSVWSASGYAVMPRKIVLPPTQYGYISTQTISTAGTTSILKYLLENNIVTASGNGRIQIVPSKWLQGAGAGGTIGTAGNFDRMMAYTQEKNYVRYPMTPLQRTPIQYDSIFHKCTYFCRLGVVEVVYPETLGYRDGI